MISKRLFRLTVALLCMALLCGSICAAQVDSDSIYCFSAEDFQQEEQLTGICIMELPDAASGTVMLGNRVVRAGDILTAEQLAQMTFFPVRSEADAEAVVTYLPIYPGKVEAATEMTISIRGKKDEAPVAEDSTLETYKNIPNEGKLKATDPEGEVLTYTVIRQPKRGTVEIREDGTFVYTPKKNKVGVDSFVYTATDPSGKVSREATVTVRILKPSDGARYTDTAGLDCQFEAEWLRNTGLFRGEKLAGADCFQPDKTVTRGQFMAMLVKLLEIDMEQQPVYTELAKDAPQWLQPYLAAAVRSGLLANWQAGETGTFDAEAPITGQEAAIILQNVLDLPVVAETAAVEGQEAPTAGEIALAVMNENGFALESTAPLTRGQVAEILYQVSCMGVNAPGLAVFQMQ